LKGGKYMQIGPRRQ